jgi:S1-C subfamily serine protease
MKTIKFLFLLFCLILLNSCVISARDSRFPTQSFVKVHAKMTVEICSENTAAASVCKKNDFYSVGSGAVVGHKGGNTVILTAGHVCHDALEGSLKKIATNVSMEFRVQNTKNEYYPVRVKDISPEFINGNELDLCLLESNGIISMPVLHVAMVGPKVGEKIYNVAAPTGFFYPPTVPLLSGYYSGPLHNQYHDLITIPATGGSSGSPVLNKKGELIGLIFAANVQFQHLTISIRHETVRKYLQRHLYP